MFGVSYSALNPSEQSIIHAMCTYNYNLRVIEKVSETNPNAKGSESNNLLRIPTVSGGECTRLIQSDDGYVYPLVFEIVGVKDIFLGVKVSLYDPRGISETAVFLPTNHASWIFQNEILSKKFHHFAIDSLPLSNYFITHVFKNIAVAVLHASLIIKHGRKVPPSIQGFNVQTDSPTLLRLETLFNPTAAIAFFQAGGGTPLTNNFDK